MDGTKNEPYTSAFSWSGFPTLLFHPANSSKPISFLKEYTISALRKFVQEHATHFQLQRWVPEAASTSAREFQQKKVLPHVLNDTATDLLKAQKFAARRVRNVFSAFEKSRQNLQAAEEEIQRLRKQIEELRQRPMVQPVSSKLEL